MTSLKLIRTAVFLTVLGVATAGSAQTMKKAGAAINDAWITTQIHAKYFLSSDVKGRNIDVDTDHGVVTLSGEVNSAAERQEALSKAQSVDGVSKVIDKLKVVPVEKPAATTGAAKTRAAWPSAKAHVKSGADKIGTEISDTWITTKVQSKYFLDSDVKALQIDVTTKDGVVTLTGTVDNPAAQKKAMSLAKSTDGVKQVVDKLTVK